MNYIFVSWPESLGAGLAVLRARPAVGDEPFAVLKADDLMIGQRPITRQLIQDYWETGSCVLSLQDATFVQTLQCGVVAGKEISPTLIQVSEIVDKPVQMESPSTFAVSGCYVITGGILINRLRASLS